MDDLDLDRELRHALQVTPSPEFVARVRASIAKAPRPSILASVLRPTLAIACTAVLVVAVAMSRQEARLKPSPTQIESSRTQLESSRSQLEPRPTEIVGSQTEMVPPTADVKVSTSERSVTDGSRATRVQPKGAVPAPVTVAQVRTTAKEEPLPEVIIAPEDAEAVRQFLSSAYDQRFFASFEGAPASDPSPLPAAAPR